MKKALNVVGRFFRDEKAAEVTELGIVLALIVALAVGFIVSIGQSVSTTFATIDANL